VISIVIANRKKTEEKEKTRTERERERRKRKSLSALLLRSLLCPGVAGIFLLDWRPFL
jgi:hypothetical protein